MDLRGNSPITSMIELFSFQSIVAKKFTKYILSLVAIILVVLVVSVKAQESVFNRNFENNAKFITRVLGESTLESVASNDFAFLENLIDNLITNQIDILYIIILSEDDNVLISTIESYISQSHKDLSDPFSRLIMNDDTPMLRKEKHSFIRDELIKENKEIESEIEIIKSKHVEYSKLDTVAAVQTELNPLLMRYQDVQKFYLELVQKKYSLENTQNMWDIKAVETRISQKQKEQDILQDQISTLQSLIELYQLSEQKKLLIDRIPKDNMIYEVSAPIGRNMGMVRIGYSPKQVREFIGKMYLSSFLIGCLFVVIVLVIAILLAEERKNLENIVELRTKELNLSLNKLEEINAHLHEVLQHKTRFLNTMSHELRTPLNAVIGFTDVLDKQYFGKLNEKQLEYVNLIGNSGEHLLSLINDVLDFAKIDSGAIDLTYEKFVIYECIQDVVSLFASQFKAKGIELVFEPFDKKFILNADKRKMKQILLNLLSNALKFTPNKGKVIIQAENRESDLFISVSDTGCGIKKDDIENIFSEFFQSDQTRDSALGGIGLGLALTRRLVKMHGGKIGVQSEVNVGSKFWFTIPNS